MGDPPMKPADRMRLAAQRMRLWAFRVENVEADFLGLVDIAEGVHPEAANALADEMNQFCDRYETEFREMLERMQAALQRTSPERN